MDWTLGVRCCPRIGCCLETCESRHARNITRLSSVNTLWPVLRHPLWKPAEHYVECLRDKHTQHSTSPIRVSGGGEQRGEPHTWARIKYSWFQSNIRSSTDCLDSCYDACVEELCTGHSISRDIHRVWAGSGDERSAFHWLSVCPVWCGCTGGRRITRTKSARIMSRKADSIPTTGHII